MLGDNRDFTYIYLDERCWVDGWRYVILWNNNKPLHEIYITIRL